MEKPHLHVQQKGNIPPQQWQRYFLFFLYFLLYSVLTVEPDKIDDPLQLLTYLVKTGYQNKQTFTTDENWSKKSFYHESTKVRKHEKDIIQINIVINFVLS